MDAASILCSSFVYVMSMAQARTIIVSRDKKNYIPTQFSNTILDLSFDERDSFHKNLMSIAGIVIKKQIISKSIIKITDLYIFICVCPSHMVVNDNDLLDEIYGFILFQNIDGCMMMKIKVYDNCKISDLSVDRIFYDSIPYDRIEQLKEKGIMDVKLRFEQALKSSRGNRILPKDRCPCGSGLKFKDCCRDRFQEIMSY